MFKYNGKSSNDFGLQLLSELELTSAEQDITFEEIPGVDGDVAIDNKRLKGVTRSFPCIVTPPTNKTIEQVSQEITGWLRPNEVGWYPFEWEGDPEYQYLAMHYQEYDLSRIINRFGKCTLSFRFKPVKYLKTGLKEIAVTNNQIIDNIGNTNAKPLITIIGSGNITLTIGTKKASFIGVDKGVIVDCQSQSVLTYDGKRPAWSNIVDAEFPVIEQGKQKVTWTGSVTQVKIIPRLGAKL